MRKAETGTNPLYMRRMPGPSGNSLLAYTMCAIFEVYFSNSSLKITTDTFNLPGKTMRHLFRPYSVLSEASYQYWSMGFETTLTTIRLYCLIF